MEKENKETTMPNKKTNKDPKSTLCNGSIEIITLSEGINMNALFFLNAKDAAKVNEERDRIAQLLPRKSPERREQIAKRSFFDLLKLFINQKLRTSKATKQACF